MFREKDLFKANNLYTFLDKSQHMLANKMFAQSSINQVKLEKDSAKFQTLMGGSEEELSSSDHAPSTLAILTTNLMGSQQTRTKMSSGGDGPAQRSINKSLAKLEQHSLVNWSRRDLKLEAVATGNSVFHRVSSQLDP